MERINPVSLINARLLGRNCLGEATNIFGVFCAECFDKEGKFLWSDTFPNTVVTVGKNLLLSTNFSGVGYTVTGPFMGMIALTGFSGISAADTMSSHAGWLEAGGANAPQYSGTRATCVFGAPSGGAISLSSTANFTFSAAGTVKGGFVCYGSGAVATIDNTGGTLFSAGLFTTGDRVVQIGDQLNISYSVSM